MIGGKKKKKLISKRSTRGLREREKIQLIRWHTFILMSYDANN